METKESEIIDYLRATNWTDKFKTELRSVVIDRQKELNEQFEDDYWLNNVDGLIDIIKPYFTNLHEFQKIELMLESIKKYTLTELENRLL